MGSGELLLFCYSQVDRLRITLSKCSPSLAVSSSSWNSWDALESCLGLVFTTLTNTSRRIFKGTGHYETGNTTEVRKNLYLLESEKISFSDLSSHLYNHHVECIYTKHLSIFHVPMCVCVCVCVCVLFLHLSIYPSRYLFIGIYILFIY